VSAAVIFLNGASSAGKTSIARCLQRLLPEPAVVVGIDTLLQSIPPQLFGHERGITFLDGGGIETGETFEALGAAWRQAVAELARHHRPVVVDEVLLDGADAQTRWRATLGDLAVLWVGVRCDPDVASARELARGDRTIGLARWQSERVHSGVGYDLEVDTTSHEAIDCARAIVAALTPH